MKTRLNKEQYSEAIATAHKWKHLPVKQKLVRIYMDMKPPLTAFQSLFYYGMSIVERDENGNERLIHPMSVMLS